MCTEFVRFEKLWYGWWWSYATNL